MEPLRIHHVGMRTFKTALATALCALAYYFVGRSPAFACIGVIFGMGYNLEDARKNGGNRLFGTIIGGVVGVLLALFVSYVFPRGWIKLWPVRWRSMKVHAKDAWKRVHLLHFGKKKY